MQATRRTPRPLKQRYQYLYDERVEEDGDGTKRFHQGRLWRREGINVLHVKGDRFEMSFQHGRLLQPEIADGALLQASKITENAIRNSVGSGVLARLVSWGAKTFITDAMLRHGLAEVKGDETATLAEAYGLSESAGVSVDTIICAALGPETAQVLLGLTEGIAAGASVSNCTSFAAWGSKTAGGDMIIGRNTDYPLNGFYDRHPTLIYYEPTEDFQKYMTTTSAGFHNAGVVGMNQSGIYLAVHTVPSKNVSASGLPVFMVGQQVLRTATCFDDAVDLILKARSAAGWNYHLVSTRERRAATIELSSDCAAIRPAAGDLHITTNHWTQPEMSVRHLWLNETVEQDSRARMQRVGELVAAAEGALDAETAASILGDKLDPIERRVRAFPNTVAAHMSVSSSVWLPDSGRMFMANGRAPVSLNTYVEFPTWDRFDPEAFASSSYLTIRNGRFRSEHPDMARAEQLYIEAKMRFEYDNDAEATLRLLEEAARADDSNPALHLVLALIAIRAEKLAVARRAVDSVLAAGFDPQREVLALYLLGRLEAHDKNARAALDAFGQVEAHAAANAKLLAATERARKRVKRRGRLRLRPNEISVMMMLPDAFRYTSATPW